MITTDTNQPNRHTLFVFGEIVYANHSRYNAHLRAGSRRNLQKEELV